ncbi:prealbumin-like fold domain-containing protein [Klugiella xanthotipulae]|nr:LPXTG cell wall anchor domain-containing protein [Klugiella xanthotipulae]
MPNLRSSSSRSTNRRVRALPSLFTRTRATLVGMLVPALVLGVAFTGFSGTAAQAAVGDTRSAGVMTTTPVIRFTALGTKPATVTPNADPAADPAAPSAATPTVEVPVADPAPAPVVEEPATDTSATDTPAADPVTDPAPAVEEPVVSGPAASRKAAAAPAAAATDVSVFSVPVPAAGEAVITVKVGGIRTSLTSVAGLAGVTLKLYDGNAGGPNATPRTDTWATCVSDAQGDCNFVVPNTAAGGANRDARFWIKQATPAASGYFINSTLAAGDPATSSAYQFRTGNQLRSGVTYSSTAEFMIASGSADNASGGIWQNSLNNPTAPQQCGLDVALILDLSGSVSPFITNLRNAAKTFVDSLTGTPSTVSLYTFAATAPAAGGANLGVTPVSTAAGATTVKNRIDTYTTGGTTNWDRGLYQAANAATIYDVAVVITDGNPTVYANAEGPGNTTRFREVENGIFSANAIKAQGTRMVVMGVGDGIDGSPDNLKSISGPTLNSDYFQSADYTTAGNTLRQLALGNCNGSVSVVKQVVPNTNTGENITGATPAAGWSFAATTATPGVTPTSQNGVTQAGTGAVNFPLSFSGGTTTGTVKLAETQQAGYNLVTQGGKRAVCQNIATGAAVTVTNDGVDPNAFSVDVPSTVAVSCTVYNRPPVPVASITVDKKWIVNGVSFNDGDQPLGFNSQLTLAGTNQAWSVARTGLTAGGSIAINETTSFTGRDLCTVDSSKVTTQNGATVDLALPYSATLLAGSNTYTVTNTVTCTAQVTLVKQVQGGSVTPSSWTLDAVAPAGALAGPNGATGTAGATAPVTPNVRYPLVESGGSGLYTQSITAGGVPVAPSIGSWQCVQLDSGGNVIPGFADGINGGVTVPLGFRVRCTAVNQTASLTLIKQVVNNNGGTKLPADWTLTATPTGTNPVDVVAQSVAGSTVGNTINVRPGTAYNLTETGPSGYTQTSLQCNTGPGGTFVDATSVTLNPLDQVTCQYVNDDQGAKLTLVKNVQNGTTGATHTATEWTLTAAGPTPLSGVTGSPAVTAANVNIGAYTLGETGPAGYTAGAWSCTGATLAAGVVTLVGNSDATCTITNTANQPTLTLVKNVQNGTTGATSVASDWTLTATGPSSTITGAGNSAAVTNQNATIGTYTLSEAGGPAGYTASAWSCVGGASTTGTTVTLALGSSATCTITNTAVAPTLTLVKNVANTSGGSAAASAWTLGFTGPQNGSGATGTSGVTSVTVPVGAYALSETGGASGYTASAWSCVGGSLAGSTVTVGLGQNVTCTITNTDQPATLTLVKVVSGGETGSTKTAADWTLTATPNSITGQNPVSGNGTGVTADGGIQVQSVFSGSYTLAEDGPSGFDAGNWVCQGGVVTDDTVAIPAGGNVICTITNTAVSPELTLVKTVDNGSGLGTAVATDWTLSAAGPTPISGATASATVTAAPVKVGEYTLSETGPTGYTASDWVCDGGELDGNVLTLAEGEEVSCAIVNTAIAPKLTLVKNVANGSTGGTAVATDWTLNAAGGPAGNISGVSGSAAVTNAAAKAATYTLTETDGPTGYTASTWACVGATATTASTVQLAAGQSATCQITNTAVAPVLTLVKEVDNGDTGATQVPADWTLTADGPTTVTGASGAATVTDATVTAGSYDLSESGPEGYDASDWTCDTGHSVSGGAVELAVGDEVTCTITNTAQESTLTLVKTVSNTHGGVAVADDWTLEAGDLVSGITGVSETVPVGSYDLSETGGPSGYTLQGLSCTGSTGTSVGNPEVTIGLGDDVTCTFTNADQPASLSLTKLVDPGSTGATEVAADWMLTATPDGITGQDPVEGAGGFAATPVSAGVYDLSEDGPDGYTASDWTCVLGSGSTQVGTELTLTSGSSAACTITNTAQAPTITLVKDVENTHGGALANTEFPLTATSGATVVTGETATPEVTDVEVPIGSYTLTETNPDTVGYTLDELSCTVNGDAVGTSVNDPTVALALGDDAICTFVNDDKAATLTLIKDVQPNDSGTTKLPKDWTLTATPNGITGQDPVTGNGTGVTADGGVQQASVFAGTYDLSEDGPTGFEPGDWVCEGGVVDDGSVTVPNGGNVICTITNTATSPLLTLVKVVDNGTTGGTAVATDWSLTAAGPTPITGVIGAATVTDAPVQVGTYTLSEAGAALGYTASEWSCTGATVAAGQITLAEGDDATCTITNTAQASVWTVAKSSTPPSGSSVQPGSQIDYTLTIVHTGGVLPTGVEVTDNLSDVLDEATLVGTPVASVGTAALSGTNLVWTVGTFSGTQTLSYSVRVNNDAIGATLHNVVTPPTGSSCVGECETTHYTPEWALWKTSDPATGSVVQLGDEITYTLHAENTGAVPATGVSAIDDLSDVLDDATLSQPLAPGLTYDPGTQKLTWALPTMAVGAAESTVSYTVTVKEDAFGADLNNVVTPTIGGECPVAGQPGLVPVDATCETEHHVPNVNLFIAKSHAPVEGGAVDSGRDQQLDYTIEVSNIGDDPAHDTTVSDTLPDGLTYVEGSLVVPAGWTATFTNGTLSASYAGDFNPGDTASFTYSTIVGDIARVSPTGAFVDIANTACDSTSDPDSDTTNDCATDVTPVKSLAVTALAVCQNDTPLASYSVTPINLTELPSIALIWWTPEAYAAHDPSIDASDTAAILADGASQVNQIPVPAGWQPGDVIEGTQLWPGAAVDAAGEPIDWPGWTLGADGVWFLDPSAPFYNLRDEAALEVRVNPSTASTLVYPPATPNCSAYPPGAVPAGLLSNTGSDSHSILLAGGTLLLLGLGAGMVGMRRRREGFGRPMSGGHLG